MTSGCERRRNAFGAGAASGDRDLGRFGAGGMRRIGPRVLAMAPPTVF